MRSRKNKVSDDSESDEKHGKNWLVLGDVNTGKSFITLSIALSLYKQGKKIIVFDGSNNRKTYGIINGIEPDFITAEEFMETYLSFGKDSITVVNWDDVAEFDELLIYCTKHVRNSCIVLDDLDRLFESKPPKNRTKICSTTKNNCNDVFYQIHEDKNVGPDLGAKIHVVVMKQMASEYSGKNLPYPKQLASLHQEIIEENFNYPPKKKWAWRMLDKTTGIITYTNEQGKLQSMSTIEYLKNRGKR